MTKGIALGFSGGVDSTIAAIKLAQSEYNVHAVYLKMWKWQDEKLDEQKIKSKVTEILKSCMITSAFIDASELMKKTIIDEFGRQLEIGNTPSPCIRCNPLVKFRLLLDYAHEHDLEAISTGHYARIRQNADGSYSLLRAIDLSKDQSYMLCYLNQEILSKTLFPLGYTAKTDNKRIAKEMGLSVSDEPESQDLCFVNKNSYQDYIKQFSPEILKPGNIINVRGEILGRHAGLALYTIGQRKGIKIASKEAYYVIDKDISNNRLVVGYQSELGKKEMLVEQVNWISGIPPVSDVCDVKIRYRSKLNKCRIVEGKESNNYMVYFNEPIRDITPGQYAVFYQEDEMLGGGMIKQHV